MTLYRLNKIIILIITFFLFFFNFANSDILKKFEITGNERVSDETIVMFSKLNLNQKINDKILNDAIKELYYTDYFKDISIGHKNGIVEIKVIENPIIQLVKINGIDEKKNIRKYKKSYKKN